MLVVAVSPEYGLVWHRQGELFPERYGFYWNFIVSSYVLRYFPNIQFVCVRPGIAGDVQETTVDRIRVITVPRVRSPVSAGVFNEFSPALPSVVHNIVSESRETVVHVHEYRALNSLLVIGKIKHRLLLQHHGAPPPRVRVSSAFSRARPPVIGTLGMLGYYGTADLFERSYLKYGSRFFVLCEGEARYLSSALGIDRDRVKVQTMGVDFDKIKPLNYSQTSQIRDKLGIHRDAQLAVFVGNIDRSKGANFLPLIHKLVKRRKPNFELLAIGPLLDTRVAHSVSKAGIKLAGSTPHQQAVRLIAAADVFIMPAPPSYYWGGVGVATMEAMACNIPVVTPTLTHVPRGLRDNIGKLTPWLRGNGDVITFAESVISALDQPKPYQNSREIARSMFGWEVIARGVVSAYEDIVASG